MKQDFKSLFHSKQLYVGIFAFFMCLLLTTLPMFLERCAQGDKEYMSAMDLTFVPIFFGGTILVLPFCASLGSAHMQVDEIRSNFISYRCLRSGFKKYVFEKINIAFFSGALILFVAGLMHVVLCHLLGGVYDPENRPYIEVSFAEGTCYDVLTKSQYGYRAYLHLLIGFMITGGVLSVFSLTFSAFFPDTVLVLSLSVVLYYVLKNDFTHIMFGFSLPDIAALYNDGTTFQLYAKTLFQYGFMLCISIFLYCYKMKRRIIHAE